jgi:hypothetical protein
VAAVTSIFFKHVSGKLEDMSFNTRLHVWAQQDYVPSHYSLELHQWLSENYPGRWVCHRCAVPVSVLISRSLSSNGSTCHNIHKI